MSFKNGKVFSYGHTLVPVVLAVLFIYGNQDPVIAAAAGASMIWAFVLIAIAQSEKPFFDIVGRLTYVVYSVIDFLLLGVAFTLGKWETSPHPIGLTLLLVILYAFELGIRRTIPVCILSTIAIYLYCSTQDNISFWSMDTFIVLGGIIICVGFIGPSADRLNKMAYYDALTGLPNRRMFTEHLQASLDDPSHKKPLAGVMFIDVDGFKYINDTMGHGLGDQLLVVITSRLRKVLSKPVLLARMGGDEFALLIPGMKTTDEAAELAELLLNQFAASFSLGNQEVYVTVSIGISVGPDDGHSADTLMRNADTAMYLAKDQGRNNYQFYSAPTDNDGMERVQMETMLRHALERNEFVVYYQPRVDIKSGKMVCVEALIRWIHPERGIISPVEFIPLAEDTGLIVAIGELVLRKVCIQRKQWTEMGMPPFRISVNLSARQFRQTDLPEVIESVLRSTGISASMLEFELTESAAMQDVNYAILMLRVLKDMGLTIAIDDFGTGYSSLSYLKRFPLDVLKIDKSFTNGIHHDSDDAAIVRAIIAMGHSLKLSITAEGVETTEQLHYLEELGCNEIQGYLIGKPMAPEVLNQWFKLTCDSDGAILTPA